MPYFLVCRSIELEIKSRLLTAATQKQVRKYSHKISEAYRALPDDEQILDQDEVAVLDLASSFYEDKNFEYWSPELAVRGYRRMARSNRRWRAVERLVPALDEIEAIAAKLNESGDHTPEVCGHLQ